MLGCSYRSLIDVQAQDSPLLVTTAAGSAALPTLLKLANIMSAQAMAELTGRDDQLPVEVPLGKEFIFHSIFACPVSRDQVSPKTHMAIAAVMEMWSGMQGSWSLCYDA